MLLPFYLHSVRIFCLSHLHLELTKDTCCISSYCLVFPISLFAAYQIYFIFLNFLFWSCFKFSFSFSFSWPMLSFPEKANSFWKCRYDAITVFWIALNVIAEAVFLSILKMHLPNPIHSSEVNSVSSTLFAHLFVWFLLFLFPIEDYILFPVIPDYICLVAWFLC